MADYESAKTKYFSKLVSSTPSVSVVGFAQHTLVSSKYLSGVRYYSIGDVFTLNATLLEIFNKVYKQYPMSVNGSQVGLNDFNVAFDDANVSGPGSPPVDGDSFVYSKQVTLDRNNIYHINGKVGVTPSDPFGNGSQVLSPLANQLFNTYGQRSDRITDYFTDEVFRLPDNDGSSYPSNYNSVPSPFSGVWDSSQSLLLYSDTEGLFFNSSFLPCNYNFMTGYYPSQSNADYSSLIFPQPFVRVAYHSGVPHGNGTLQLSGLTYSDIQAAGNTKVEIKFPGVTGWLDLGKEYDGGTFTGVDGDGCHDGSRDIGLDGFGWTGGGNFTSSSGWLVVVRITHKNISANPITFFKMLGGSPSWE